jgi:hypothetical protein
MIEGLKDTDEVVIVKFLAEDFDKNLFNHLFVCDISYELLRKGPNKEAYQDENYQAALSDYMKARKKLDKISFNLRHGK